MKGYLLKTLQEAGLVWLALTVGVIISSILYTVLIISQVSKSTSLLISFVTLVGLILLGSFLPTKSIFLSFRHRLAITSKRKLLLIFVIGCLLIIAISILLNSLWFYRELIAFLLLGLATLVVLVTLALHSIRILTDTVVKMHEQKLRQERLHPGDSGFYEIPLMEKEFEIHLEEEEDDQALPPSEDMSREEEKPYSQRYNLKDS